MTPKQRRFLVINYWLGNPASGVLVGPVLVSTSDYRHFHFSDEVDAATLEPAEYQIIKLYPPGCSLDAILSGFAREFLSDVAAEWARSNPVVPPLLWAGCGEHSGRLSLAA